MESKIWHNESMYLQNRNRLTNIETRLTVAKGGGGEGEGWTGNLGLVDANHYI